MATPVDPDNMSAYLALRYVPWADRAWLPGRADLTPQLPNMQRATLTPVASTDDIHAALLAQLSGCDPSTTGLLLSGGIDSAILAALLPPGVKTYTIRFVAQNAVDETQRAAAFAHVRQLPHKVVEVTWQDYQTHTVSLMQCKRSPLHAIEVALHKAALQARADGVQTLVVGNGADSSFGGMDKLLSRDWTFDAFVERYTFVEPARVLADPRSLHDIFAAHKRGEHADVVSFLHDVHGPGIVQAFENAITSARCNILAPYETLQLTVPLDLARIRAGEPKYLLAALFQRFYSHMETPAKIAFARPMDQWLADWQGPRRAEFHAHAREAVAAMSGDQRWLVYCLELFLDSISASSL